MSTFSELGVSAHTLAALSRHGIEEAVPVQEAAIPALIEGSDVVIQAPTGSGKTLAFLLPMVECLRRRPGPGPSALIMVPTRELAIQVERVFTTLDSGLGHALLYGGIGYASQTLALKSRPEVIIGTPGRTLDMVGRKQLALSRIEYLVLDEADEMLDVGFAPDMEKILALTFEPQIVLASATMPDFVARIIERDMRDPVWVRVELEEESKLEHALAWIDRERKLEALSHLLRRHSGTAIVFGRTKHGVRKLNRELRQRGHRSMELQGNLSQSVRDRTMESFREQRTDVLVATNVAARGIDVSHVGLVINYELPESPQWLTHRVGRTARMGAEGRAITFLTSDDQRAWQKLRRLGAPEIPEVDFDHLISHGGWRYVASGSAPVPAAEAGNGRRRRRRRRPHRAVPPPG